MRKQVESTRRASRQLMTLHSEQRNHALRTLRDIVKERTSDLLDANARDLAQAQKAHLSPSLLGRLKLDASKLTQLGSGFDDLIALPDPLGVVSEAMELDQNLILKKILVPIGVVALVFESRPDVVPQVLSLMLKTGNAVIFKGGSEAEESNAAFMACVDELNRRCQFLPPHWAQRVQGRDAFQTLLKFNDLIDLVVPRGSNQLVQSIMSSTTIPVLGHADGVCHIYVEHSYDSLQALAIIQDAKTQYPAACNAVETLLVEGVMAADFLPRLKKEADKWGVRLRGCDRTCAILTGIERVGTDEWHTEYGDLTLAVKIVGTCSEAIDHINSYGSHHTDAILTESERSQTEFLKGVDAACVFVNASTRFSDGYRFGKGAEVGISTSKLHARGPVGIEGLITYKYELHGQGQIVGDYTGAQARPFVHKRL